MSRTEYMRELDALLQGISKEEREEAMQYYNDYFDDAGSENEEKVIEELGSPAKLAETIRAGINGNTDEAESYGEYGERGYQDRRFVSLQPAHQKAVTAYSGMSADILHHTHTYRQPSLIFLTEKFSHLNYK